MPVVSHGRRSRQFVDVDEQAVIEVEVRRDVVAGDLEQVRFRPRTRQRDFNRVGERLMAGGPAVIVEIEV